MAITVHGNLTLAGRSSLMITTRSKTIARTPLRARNRNARRHQQRDRSPRPQLRRNPRRAASEPLPIHLHRRPLPSLRDDPGFWTKIATLPENLYPYLLPHCNPRDSTREILRQLIWHFNPARRIPSDTLKDKILEYYQEDVVRGFGAYYGV
ncbi:uncharacterized protein MELLADRAFT_104222 [Melampsora larici-populina 98AG31]|uniref:Uncharacterized protein n=1 Tax=Melampsora larici-populina (strain 98AG31 / pathotype 3-4-7) TaxID=747676 RepID=F4RDZ9_MELLP|nr:uncharacterized protein MELLADRAFT_104222 [Melampsora larici-populina 98AG31]EGG09526.1 hypothetical protein MELLADRAFT_104222 [Melampsora larici-populina 98AG31]